MATIGAGDLVAGRYRLIRPDGGSAAMRIWEARDEVLGRPVTVREVPGRKRLGMAEAQTLARHNRVLDVVEEPGRVWIITSVGGGAPDAVGLARVGDLTTELDRPGIPRRPLAAASQPPPAASGPPAAAPASGAPLTGAAASSAPVSGAAVSDAPDSGAAASIASDSGTAQSDAPFSSAAAFDAAVSAAAAPDTGATAAAFDSAGTDDDAAASDAAASAAASDAVASGAVAADPWAGATETAVVGARHGDAFGGSRPAVPAGVRGSGFGELAVRLGAPASPGAAGDRPVWRRPRNLILATAVLIVIGAGAGIALAAVRPTGHASTGAQRPPATSPAVSGAGAGPAVSGVPAGTGVSGAAAGPGVSGAVVGPGVSPKAAAPDPAAGGVPVATFVPCGDGAPQGVMMGTPSTREVPAGYVWHRDFQGFAFDVPSGWQRSRVKNTFCFRDPAGGRGFVVTGGVSATDPAATFAAAERVARRTLPGYRRVGLTANGWEYTWTVDGVVRHSRQVVVTPRAGAGYGVQWITADARWADDEPLFAYILGTFEVVPKS